MYNKIKQFFCKHVWMGLGSPDLLATHTGKNNSRKELNLCLKCGAKKYKDYLAPHYEEEGYSIETSKYDEAEYYLNNIFRQIIKKDYNNFFDKKRKLKDKKEIIKMITEERIKRIALKLIKILTGR